MQLTATTEGPTWHHGNQPQPNADTAGHTNENANKSRKSSKPAAHGAGAAATPSAPGNNGTSATTTNAATSTAARNTANATAANAPAKAQDKPNPPPPTVFSTRTRADGSQESRSVYGFWGFVRVLATLHGGAKFRVLDFGVAGFFTNQTTFLTAVRAIYLPTFST